MPRMISPWRIQPTARRERADKVPWTGRLQAMLHDIVLLASVAKNPRRLASNFGAER